MVTQSIVLLKKMFDLFTIWSKFWKRILFGLSTISWKDIQKYKNEMKRTNNKSTKEYFFVKRCELLIQCDQIGRFLKVLGDIVSHKVAQMHGDFLGIFEKQHFSSNSYCSFLGNLQKIWTTLYFNIWSHWLLPTLNWPVSIGLISKTAFKLGYVGNAHQLVLLGSFPLLINMIGRWLTVWPVANLIINLRS